MNSPGQIKRIERAKLWAGVLLFIFAGMLVRDVVYQVSKSRHEDSWFFGAGSFRVNGEVVENKDRTSETGVMITGNSYNLQKRGEPRWILNFLALGSVLMVLSNLRAAYRMPDPQRHAGGTMPPPGKKNWSEAPGSGARET